MWSVQLKNEPTHFDVQVRQAGLSWLAANPGSTKFQSFWRHCALDLAREYEHRCAYSTFYQSTPGDVDHFTPKSLNPNLAYEWSNYRYANSRINTWKGNKIVLDPFLVQEGWFNVNLESLEVIVTDMMPAQHVELAHHTIEVLKLSKDQVIKNFREQLLLDYLTGDSSINNLRKMSPLMAWAVLSPENAERLSFLKIQIDKRLAQGAPI